MQLLVHAVSFTLLSGVSRQDPRVAEAVEISRQHGAHSDDVLVWACGLDNSGRDDSFDFSAIGYFQGRDSLKRFLLSDDHLRGVDAWRLLATWAVCDFWVPRSALVFGGLP